MFSLLSVSHYASESVAGRNSSEGASRMTAIFRESIPNTCWMSRAALSETVMMASLILALCRIKA